MPVYGASLVPWSISDHRFRNPFCGCTPWNLTISLHLPRGCSPQVWVVMNGQLVNPSLESSSLGRRLRIIDLTPNASQPMSNEDGTVQVVFNGEIYNYRTLREGLVARGHRFRSQSDTEVIVHLYEEKGADCIADLEGMFAIAIWDETAARMTLARDRAGKKPLFYYRDHRLLAFASEMKSFFHHPEISIEPDPEGDVRTVRLNGHGARWNGVLTGAADRL